MGRVTINMRVHLLEMFCQGDLGSAFLLELEEDGTNRR